jgi:hypothetical protein
MLAGCGFKDEPMPLTKANIDKYMERVNRAAAKMQEKQAEVGEEKFLADEKMRDEFVRIVLVVPMNDTGYSYDKTINAIARRFLNTDLPPMGWEQYSMLFSVIKPAVQVRQTLLNNRHISPETSDMLIKVGKGS